MMQWVKKNWGWLIANVLAFLPLLGVLALINIDISGNGSFLTFDIPSRMGEGGRGLSHAKSMFWFPIHSTGEWAIRWLTVSLTITPLAILFRWKKSTRYRKLFGLYAFLYSFLHLIFYIADKGFLEIFSETNLILGLIATAVMIALAMTSNNKAKQILKKKWKSLHRLIYPAAILAILHVALLEKGSWAVYAVIIAIGYVIRTPVVRSPLERIRKRRRRAIAA